MRTREERRAAGPGAETAEVEAAYAEYEAAVLSGDRRRRILGRLRLFIVLQSDGWTPPAVVREQMERDALELRGRVRGWP